ncbi:four-carbon acid sugar kinase family protein [Roseburia sp. 499]|uniref:four-carbon acid sugar kinase family protein n=1 Tax=Roseburia sp. 499 TaxID=1261634 RepID=UPI000951B923|nr:four-carbon acid sugar kinase family protein [Roseburia sp. 499]WVK71400.1 four-carbon acid sugar kinase family protein [Roseburia sp. 499]
MADCLIIADDLTGANATGALLQKINYTAYTVMNTERLELNNQEDCDCILYPTDSRGVSPEIAYNRVYNVSKLLQQEGIKIYSKRIDSTLRGNLGSETDAFLDSFSEKRIAIVAPCFPDSGRVVCGGYMLVNGVPLHKTSAAIDPKTPVTTSKVEDIYRAQSKYPVASLDMEDLRKGKEHIVASILKLEQDGIRTIIFDCISQEDLDLIADAVIESKVSCIMVDPGPFTMTVVRKSIVPKTRTSASKILAVVGSVNPVTTTQVEEFLLSQSIHNVFAKTEQFLMGEESRKQEIERIVTDILNNCADYEVCSVVGDGIYPENRIDFEKYTRETGKNSDELCKIINHSLAEIARRLLDSSQGFKGIYSSGGDVTVAICQNFQASGIQLLGEVLPLAAYGEILGGDYAGIRVVTKGGMVGEPSAMRECINYLKEKLFM